MFSIAACSDCSFLFTQDVPDEKFIVPYYKSDGYISHTNTARGFINSLYQKVRKRTIRQKRKLICKMTRLQKGSLLDIGSGTGAFVQEMETHGWNVRGLEPDADARKLAAELFRLQLEDVNSLYTLPESGFDAITLWHVLEHVHDLEGYMIQLKKLLKPGGKLFIAVPNYTSTDAAVYGSYWAAFDVPRHLYHFSPHSMEVLLKKHGLLLETCKPMWYDSFYVSMLSSKYKNGKTNLAGAVWTGMRSNIRALFNVKKCSSVIYIISR